MDAFSTVAAAITLAERIWKLIDDYRKPPERLRRMKFDVKSLQAILERLKAMKVSGNDQRLGLLAEIVEIDDMLHKLLECVSKLHNKPSENVLSRSFKTFRTQKTFEDLDELASELQRRKASLILAINTANLDMVANIEAHIQRTVAEPARELALTTQPTDAPPAYQMLSFWIS